MVKIEFSEHLSEVGIFINIATMVISDFSILKKKYNFKQKINEISEFLKQKYDISNLKDNQIISKYREFYWHKLNIDPTKIRPSSETLIRRILKNQKIPKISPFVDAYNWASAESFIPMGAYDIDAIQSPIYFRLTKDNEKFIPIGKKEQNLLSNILVISDSSSPRKILSQYPYRDSKLSMVSKKTKNILIIACGVPGIVKNDLFKALDSVKKNLDWFSKNGVFFYKNQDFVYYNN